MGARTSQNSSKPIRPSELATNQPTRSKGSVKKPATRLKGSPGQKSITKKIPPKKKLPMIDWVTIAPAPVVGVDEVGRGCLAGPVVAAAVILSKASKKLFFDSKILTEVRREELFAIIQAEHAWAVGFASVLEIDRLNIFHASHLAMRRAVNALQVKNGHVLVDGKFKIPYLRGMVQTALVQGDSRAEPVSAASIVAKVTRDRWMKKLSEKFPHYGFEIHKGYATEFHREALKKHGPCKHHRRNFNGVDFEAEIQAELGLGVEGSMLVEGSPLANPGS